MDFLLQFLLVSLPLLSFLYLLPQIIKSTSRFGRRPPGPHRLPFIGNLHQIDKSSLHTSLWQLSKSYGPLIFLRFGFIPTIVVSSASLAKQVLKTQDIIFCSRPSLLGLRKLSYNGLDVAFSPHNNNWRDMRKIFVLHLFSPKRVHSFRYIREDEVSSAMNRIHELALLSKQVNLSEIAKSVSNTIVMRVGFGKRYQDGHERKKIFGLLSELQATLADLYISDIWPGLPFVGLVDSFTGRMDRLQKCFQDFDAFYQQLIDEHLKAQYGQEEEDFIDILLQLMKDKHFSLTYDHVKAVLMNVLVAGTDSTSATIVWVMTLLIKNPKVMKKAQEEVRNVVQNKGKVEEDDLPKLTYLEAVIKETMRLHPAVPLLVPHETQKDVILNGYEIKQKTVVYVNSWAIGRDPESWKSPNKFLPERFLGGSDIDFKGNDFELIPFGSGRRICPGMTMGVVMVKLLLANLLYMFDWGFPNGMTKEDIHLDALPGLTIHKRNELCLLAYAY